MKTAGTSIEVALSRYLGADDVITPIFEEDEPLRAAPGYRGPQNYLVPLRRWKRKRLDDFSPHPSAPAIPQSHVRGENKPVRGSGGMEHLFQILRGAQSLGQGDLLVRTRSTRTRPGLRWNPSSWRAGPGTWP